MMTASTLRCGTADAITSPGRSRQPITNSTAAARKVASMIRSAGRNVRTRAYATITMTSTMAAAAATSMTGTTGAITRSPRAKTRGGYLNSQVVMDSNQVPTE